MLDQLVSELRDKAYQRTGNAFDDLSSAQRLGSKCCSRKHLKQGATERAVYVKVDSNEHKSVEFKNAKCIKVVTVKSVNLFLSAKCAAEFV